MSNFWRVTKFWLRAQVALLEAAEKIQIGH